MPKAHLSLLYEINDSAELLWGYQTRYPNTLYKPLKLSRVGIEIIHCSLERALALEDVPVAQHQSISCPTSSLSLFSSPGKLPSHTLRSCER
jgi:hypothetical protein